MKFTLFFLLLLNLALSTTMAVSSSSDMEIMTVSNRKLKESLVHPKSDDAAGSVNMEDYNPIDPVPSSKAIRHGPIEHGSPLNPFIPKPPPPARPRR